MSPNCPRFLSSSYALSVATLLLSACSDGGANEGSAPGFNAANSGGSSPVSSPKPAASTGGSTGSGMASGGLSSGGAATGGLSSGGAATGGLSSGGAATGGLSSGGSSTGGNGNSAFDPQLPPGNKAELTAWLQAFVDNEWEKQWACEPMATAKTEGSPAIHAHGGTNRVCSNQALSQAVLAPGGQLPVGVAAVKFVSSGIYVEVKVEADSNGGAGWFWYSPGGGVAAKGAGACVNCHGAAGSDTDHPGLGDYVYFRVAQ